VYTPVSQARHIPFTQAPALAKPQKVEALVPVEGAVAARRRACGQQAVVTEIMMT
jgi:hypothetical protein